MRVPHAVVTQVDGFFDAVEVVFHAPELVPADIPNTSHAQILINLIQFGLTRPGAMLTLSFMLPCVL